MAFIILSNFVFLFFKPNGQVPSCITNLVKFVNDQVKLFDYFIGPRELPKLHSFYEGLFEFLSQAVGSVNL